MAPEIANKIDDRYEVLGEVGRGGMGVVYKANDVKMDRLVAIKVMTAHAPGNEEYQHRFLREAKSIAKIQHPNIVVVHDYGYHAGAPYMAMEYVEGVSLDRVIAARLNLAPLAKVDFIIQVCHALHHAHQLGIIHRDVKPGNIMVLEGGRRVKLLDFGIARAGGISSLSKSGLAMGTTCYMSPEQTKGQRDLDGRADIFSAGVVLYELLAGKPPWTGDSDYEVMTKIVNDPYPPLSTWLRNYPPLLDRILERSLAKDASARYPTAEKMAAELTELETPLKEQALEDALMQFEQGDLLRANELVSQILRIDTRCREAIELKSKLQQVAQLQQRSEQIRQLRLSAEQAVGQKRYTEALAAVEQAIAIDAANSELFHYRELIRHEVKRRDEVRKKLELARRAQEINDLSTAQELVDKALEADPTDTHARVMKSSLEQEKKRQQQQEIAEDVSRALAVRAFPRAQELIQQLEALDPDFAPLASLRKALLDGEAEEKRRIEVEDLLREVRRTLETGDVAECLSVTEKSLARFPDEPRLVRLRAQAEALRDAAEREGAIQEQVARINQLTAAGRNSEALATAESALKRFGTDYRLQRVAVQLRQTLERERQLRAEQTVLSQAEDAMRDMDYEFAVKILTAARNEFPASQGIADALQVAQDAINRQAADLSAENARKKEIVEALERALTLEPDPQKQVKLAEEAVQKTPANEAAERVLARVRQRQRQIASAIDRAQKFEQAQNYSESIQEWERVRQLWPQYPDLSEQFARLKANLETKRKASQPVTAETAALEPKPKKPEPPPPEFPAHDISATSMMAAAPRRAPAPPPEPVAMPQKAPPPPPQMPVARAGQMPAAPAEGIPAPPLPRISPPPVDRVSPPPVERELVEPGPVSPPAESGEGAPIAEPWWRSGKFLLAVTGAIVVALVVTAVVYLAHRPKSSPQPVATQPQPEVPVTRPVPPRPEVGTLTVQANVDNVDILVDGNFKDATEGREKTITLVPGRHTITVQKPGYAAPPQSVQIAKDQVSTLPFTLNKTEDSKPVEADTYLIIKAPSGTKVLLDRDRRNEQEVPAEGSLPFKTTAGKHRIDLTPPEGFQPWTDTVTVKAGDRRVVTADLKAMPKPPPAIVNFSANSLSIQQGQSVTLQWDTQNATEVSIDQGIGTVHAKDSLSVTPKGSSTTYTLTAKSEGGVQTKPVTINVTPLSKPNISVFTAGPDTIQKGKTAKLVWATENAEAVRIDPDVGSVEKSGNRNVSPESTTTYTLTAKGAGGTEVTKTTQISVDLAPVPPPVQQPTAPPATQDSKTEDAEIKAVKDTIEIRYRDAYQSMSMAELKRVYPVMPKDTEKAIQSIFSNKSIRAVQLVLNCSTPSINGESAHCTCKSSMSFTMDKERQPAQSNVIIFQLKKAAGRWVVTGTTGE